MTDEYEESFHRMMNYSVKDNIPEMLSILLPSSSKSLVHDLEISLRDVFKKHSVDIDDLTDKFEKYMYDKGKGGENNRYSLLESDYETCLLDNGEDKEAVTEAVENLLKLKPLVIHSDKLYCGLAAGYHYLGKHKEEIEIIEEGIKKQDIDPYYYAYYLFESNKYEEAMVYLLKSKSIKKYVAMGDIYSSTNPDKAIECYKKRFEYPMDKYLKDSLLYVVFSVYSENNRKREGVDFAFKYLFHKDILVELGDCKDVRGICFKYMNDVPKMCEYRLAAGLCCEYGIGCPVDITTAEDHYGNGVYNREIIQYMKMLSSSYIFDR